MREQTINVKVNCDCSQVTAIMTELNRLVATADARISELKALAGASPSKFVATVTTIVPLTAVGIDADGSCVPLETKGALTPARQCTCPTSVLMVSGCRCGAMKNGPES